MPSILIVEDDSHTRLLLKSILSDLQYEIIEADNGIKAIELANKSMPEMILLDISIPGIDGYEVCLKLREDSRYNMSYIIFITSRSSPEDLAKGLEYGADDYITKPFNLIEAKARIQSGLKTIKERRQSTLDELTGLYNRHFFNNYLHQEIIRANRYNSELALLLIDVDNFTRVNEEFGTEVGDLVLQGLGNQLRAFWRKTDIIARWSGEEFAMIMPSTSKEGATLSAERIREFVEGLEFEVAGGITISIGLAMFNKAENSLFSRADQALCKAKELGRNRVVCY